MDKYTVAEEAYKNGYEAGKKSAAPKRGKPNPHYITYCDSDGDPVVSYLDGLECPFCGSTGVMKFCPNCGSEMILDEVVLASYARAIHHNKENPTK